MATQPSDAQQSKVRKLMLLTITRKRKANQKARYNRHNCNRRSFKLQSDKRGYFAFLSASSHHILL